MGGQGREEREGEEEAMTFLDQSAAGGGCQFFFFFSLCLFLAFSLLSAVNYRSVCDREWGRRGAVPCVPLPSLSHFANSRRSPYNYQAGGPRAAGSLVWFQSRMYCNA